MQLADLPTRRVEAWKYTDLRAALSGREDRLAHLDAHAGASPIEGLAHALATGETTRRVTLGEDGDVWTVELPENSGSVTKVIAPVGTSGLLIERLSSWADQNSAKGFKLSAAWTDIVIEDHAAVVRVVLQSSSSQYDAADIVQLSEARVRLGKGSSFRQVILAEGAKLARIETHVSVEGEGAEVELNGAYLCGAGRHADLTSVIEHKVGGCTTKQTIHGVALKGGRGVFQGKIVVHHGAQKTDARQHHHGLLLEEGAEIFAKPELMIHADDVQCAHGNAMGGLDEGALFYMRARGIPEEQARALLIEAFLVQAIPDGLPEAVNEELLNRIRAWLAESPARAPAVQEGATS